MSTEHETTDPWTAIDLPSKFAPYDQKELFMRPLKTGEVKRLKPALINGQAYAVLDLMKATMRPLTPDDLTTGDIWFVAAWLRLNTFPNIPLSRDWKCPECGHGNSYVMNFDGMVMEELPDDYQEPVQLTLASGRVLPLRFPRAGDARTVREYLKKLRGDDPDDTAISAAETAIMIQDGTSLEDRIKFIEDELTPEELIGLDDFTTYFSHGLPNYVTDTCKGKECEYENNRVRFTFRIHDMVPIGGTGRDIRNAISFGATPPPESDGSD